MATSPNLTPCRQVITGIKAPQLEKNLKEIRDQKISRQSLLWGCINVCLLSIVLYDLAYTCPIYISYIQYLEYLGVLILSLNVIYHFGRYIKINIPTKKCEPTTPIQQKTLEVGAREALTTTPNVTPVAMNTPNTSLSATPMNMTALSWMSNSPQNESPSFSVQSQSWVYSRGSPKAQEPSPVKTPRRDTSGINFITDERSLNTYLQDFEENEKVATINNPVEQPNNLLGSFWSHPLTKNPKDVSPFLKRCQYQLSAPTANRPCNPLLLCPCDLPNYYYGKYPRPYHLYSGVSPKSPTTDDKGSPLGIHSQAADTWKRLNVDSVKLTQWNANLRMWISQTILNRLIKEFEIIDEAFQKQGLLDIQIGKVGLDRLRKTAQTLPILQFIPTLPTLVPFLELTPNQEYLVKRIQELAKGGCMSEFKWNSGSSFNGKDWDPSLPTDSAIVMHLFASYMDTQLLPLPNQPDTKPFSGYHYVKASDKMPVLTPNTLAIHQFVEYPPHYRIIVGEEIYELVKGYNNLFHSILLFLYYVNKKELGMLGRVNLGKSGVNLLWIIES